MDSLDTLIAPEAQARLAGAPARARIAGARAHQGGQASAGCSVLGRYRLLERLGAGGFGVVWRAHDGLLDREVAVKVIPLPAGGDGEDRDRATREALAAARLAHPAIVALYEACVQDDAFYLISELVHGETLAELLAAQTLCDEEVTEIGIALADALLHAHQRGVVHRDLKPHNVLVPFPASPTGAACVAKLTDFGGASLVGEEGLTRTGDVLGTLAYMAPEQIEGHEVDGQADLYSLALVLYEALSGVNPVRGPTPAATARRIGRALEPLERHRRDLPRELTRALDRALAPAPPERGTLPELREALCDALQRGLRRSPRQRHAHDSRAAPRRPPAGPEGPAPSQFPPPGTPLATVEGPLPGGFPEDLHEEAEASGWLTLPRLGWLAGTLAVCTWQLAAGRSEVALLALCAVAPLVLLVRHPGARWLAAALAPALGLAGLAGAFPALAGQATHWRSRALLGALGFWWLCLAELPEGHALVSLLGLARCSGPQCGPRPRRSCRGWCADAAPCSTRSLRSSGPPRSPRAGGWASGGWASHPLAASPLSTPGEPGYSLGRLPNPRSSGRPSGQCSPSLRAHCAGLSD